MGLVEELYDAAAGVGLLETAVWTPAAGGDPVTLQVGFQAPDQPVLDGLALATDWEMRVPASCVPGLALGDGVEIRGQTFQVWEVRALGDGTEIAVSLARQP